MTLPTQSQLRRARRAACAALSPGERDPADLRNPAALRADLETAARLIIAEIGAIKRAMQEDEA